MRGLELRDKKQTFLVVLIAALGVTAIVLGVLIWRQQNPQPQAGPSSPSQEEEATQEPPSLQELQDVLAVPGENATEEEKQAHFELAQSLAVRDSALDITDCAAVEPVVYELNVGDNVRVRNDDTNDHSIVFDQDNQYLIKAESEGEIDIDFAFGPGLYGYACDQGRGLQTSGLFLVSPQ